MTTDAFVPTDMEHSMAVLEDAGKQIDKVVAESAQNEAGEAAHNDSRKRKRNNESSAGRGDRGSTAKNDKRHKKRDMGRSEYFRQDLNKRDRIAAAGERRREDSTPAIYSVPFTQEEIEAEQAEPRRAKRKVAVMIGYAGTGYKGMQISTTERTIEGELFQAFIKAGAISKVNADDPKKAGLVRCARTDKGVHAAGNVISLKLIVEDDKIVEKINAELPEQIRVWGIERTVGSFNCYQACDSRWYEYLIPSYAFLPPHPSCFLGKQLEAMADKANDREAYEARQQEVKGYWEAIEEQYIKPIVDGIDDDIRAEVVSALRGEDEASATQEGAAQAAEKDTQPDGDENGGETPGTIAAPETLTDSAVALPATHESAEKPSRTEDDMRTQRLRAATKQLRQAYMAAKRRYRLPKERIDRVRAALSLFVGTRNYHNYTVQKTYRDPSAKRNIKSFNVNGEPILIGAGEDAEKTEWLSLKVHGQSFMMHQIRKMVSMVALLVRCGSSLDTMDHSFGPSLYSIPKVPGLGLMLERPVFDTYNWFTAPKNDREVLEFSRYETNIEAFKRKEIYARMFSEEEEKGEFSRFFNHVDHFREPSFLFVTSKGLDATAGHGRKEGYGEDKQTLAAAATAEEGEE